MERNFNRRSAQQQRCLAKQVQTVDANHFFNLLTNPQMLGMVEDQLPEHRERQFTPTVVLAMFLGQVMSADGSCQNAVNAAAIARLLVGMNPGSMNTSGYCQARQRLPQGKETPPKSAHHCGDSSNLAPSGANSSSAPDGLPDRAANSR